MRPAHIHVIIEFMHDPETRAIFHHPEYYPMIARSTIVGHSVKIGAIRNQATVWVLAIRRSASEIMQDGHSIWHGLVYFEYDSKISSASVYGHPI